MSDPTAPEYDIRRVHMKGARDIWGPRVFITAADGSTLGKWVVYYRPLKDHQFPVKIDYVADWDTALERARDLVRVYERE